MSHESTASAFQSACSTVSAVALAAADGDPAAPTPCTGFDLAALASHFVGTSGAFAQAGSGALDPSNPWGSNLPFTDDWSAQLVDHLERAGAAWGRPEVWDREVENSPMPAAALGEMGLIEVVLHGWDIAKATGQTVTLDDAVAAEVLRCVAATAELGRQFEAYGPEVAVPDGASDLDRALGLAGRDPDWTA